MAQDLTVNIKTTSDVPQAMDKAKSATVSFSKQVEDIQKKFSTAFKDVFLGFAAPMIIINKAMSMISERLEEARRVAAQGADLIAKGETVYASSDEKKLAKFMQLKAADEKERAEVHAGIQKITEDYLTKTEEGKKVAKEIQDKGGVEAELLYHRTYTEEIRKKALDAFLNSEEGKKFKPIFDAQKDAGKSSDFKAPEGFGNVIGVGPNPVMEAMNAQLEEAKKQTDALERIAAATPGALAPDFTKTATA
jgi:hypothetical protein